ncbi:MAG: hypothetical protein JW795_00935 [Chitinivibrionales bacterium]|nr:hypothetical protein [Chitinivibrionales bacterium]
MGGMDSVRYNVVSTAFLIMIAILSSGYAQQKIYDAQGQWNGLYNMNPDPNGEPWIAGGLAPMTAEQRAAYDALPFFELPAELAGRSLPKTVDHSTEPAFRPIFLQEGGSCGQASGICYHFTFERNQLYNANGKEQKNQCAPGIAWNFLNTGKDQGSWPHDGYAIAAAMGVGHVADFNGSEYGGNYLSFIWLDGYAGYYNGNDCHVTEQVKFTSNDITGLKNWFYDKATGTGKNGGVVTFVSNTTYPTKVISSGTFKGQQVITSLADGESHAQTFSGYTDEVAYDLNGDGIITNDIDINRDGSVDIGDMERGAVQLVNSWGTSWMNNGKCWVLYSGIKCNTIIGIKVEKVVTKLMVKAKITSSSRNTLVIKTGYAASVDATTPTQTKGYGKAFNKSGGAYPLKGVGQSATITIGLDCSEFASQLPGGKGTIFLQISGTGKVNEVSVMDYTAGPVAKETKSEKSNVTISGTLNIPISIETGVTHMEKAINTVQSHRVRVLRRGSDYALFVPADAVYTVTIVNQQGRAVESFTSNGECTEYPINKSLARGFYFVNAVSKHDSFTKRLDLLR